MNRINPYLRLALCVVIFGLVIELCSRVDDKITYGAPFFAPYNENSLYQYDALGKWGKPNARYKKWTLNSLGYRGPELRDGTVRIVCFGASETFGLHEDTGAEYPRQLEKQMREYGLENVQVVNAAYPGETIVTAAKRIPQIVHTVDPRFAIVYPSVASYIYLPWVANTKKSTLFRAAHNSAPFEFDWRISENLHNLMKAILPEKLQTTLRAREIQEAARRYPVMDRVPDENVRQFKIDLRSFIVLLRANGMEPVLVTHATRFGPQLSGSDRQLLTAWRKSFPMLKEDGFLDMENRMNNAIRQVSTEEETVMVDAARNIPAGDKYFADAVHFTTTGATVMAENISARMVPVLETKRSLSLLTIEDKARDSFSAQPRKTETQVATRQIAFHR